LRRNLIVLDLLLLALCAVAAWRFLDYRRERLAEQARFLRRSEAGLPPPVVLLPPAPPPAASSAYVEVAQKLLLSPDRNPDVIIDVVAPKPMPPLPRAYGAINFGEGPHVLLAEKAGARQHSYPIGGKIGEFTVLVISQLGVVFDWEGQQVAARYQELRDLTSATASEPARSSAAAQSASVTPAAAAAAAAATTSNSMQTIGPSSGSHGRLGPGAGTFRACVKDDDSPEGTMEDGFRKVSVSTPMGKSCHWEKVQ
jgi:hypothetical protein